jgi:hypothetical protein
MTKSLYEYTNVVNSQLLQEFKHLRGADGAVSELNHENIGGSEMGCVELLASDVH